MTDVLVVEDDAVVCQVMQEYLCDAGHAVRVVHNGNQALAAMARARPDVVVLDLMLPVMDGWQFVQTLRNQTRWARIPIIAASAVHDLPSQAQRLGVRACLSKPLDLQRLASQVEAATK